MFVDANSVVTEEIASERARGLKKASAKPLTAEDLAIGASTAGKAAAAAAISREVTVPEAEVTKSTHPVGTEAVDPLAQQQTQGEPIVIDEARAVAEGHAGGGQAEEATGLANVTFSTNNSGELPLVNVG